MTDPLTLKKYTALFLGFLLLAASQFALAEKGSIEVKSEAFKVIERIDEDGKKITTTQKAEDASIIPKDTILYITTVTNVGSEAAENIVVNNPIAEQLTYVEGSAEGKATEINFSIDGGKNYRSAKELTVKNKKGEEARAQPDDYNAIQWIYLPKLRAGEQTTMSFKAILGKEP